jgi:hypothetical protein
MIILPEWDLCGDGWKEQKNNVSYKKNGLELPPSILIIKNSNWS